MPPTTRKTPQDRKTTRKTASAAPGPQVHVIEDPEGKYAPTTWGSELGGAEDLTVPSGQMCLVRRPGVQGLMEAGVLRDIDSLSALVNEKHIKRVQGKAVGDGKIDAASLMQDKDGLKNLMHVVDRVICYVVMKPLITMTPNDPTSRVSGVIYADMVDLVDKMFIFQYAVGGTRGLEEFRQQLDTSVGSLGTVEAASENPS